MEAEDELEGGDGGVGRGVALTRGTVSLRGFFYA